MLQVSTQSGHWEVFCDQIETFLKADIIDLSAAGKPVRGFRSPDSPALWIRDHSDILRGGKYFEADVRSAIDAFANTQGANGRIFDHVRPRGGVAPDQEEEWVRVQVESDVEFRFVKAAYLVFQALGDLPWLERTLPALEQAMTYSQTHPWRWDGKNSLVKRPYTIDTWDFDYTAGRSQWLNFQIDDHTHWGIFHGDNSGFYEASRLLATLYRTLGMDKKAGRWLDIAESVREKANKLLFNGRFYVHFYPLAPVSIHGVDVDEQLSLSTPMAINRGMATAEMAETILEEYQHRRRQTPAFAEWFGIDPPFPDGIFGDEKLVGGAYINGGIFPLVGGELARAAFENGFEDYGVRTLEQYRRMIAESGTSYLWYFPDGRPSSIENSTSPDAMPTDGWGSSAMLYGFIEGLAGIEDLSHSFQKVRLSPRWPAANEDTASVSLSYAASGSSFAYDYIHNREKQRIRINCDAAGTDLELHILLPKDRVCKALHWNGRARTFATEKIRGSRYVNVRGKANRTSKIEITYDSA